MEADKFGRAEHSSLELDGVLAGDAFDDKPTAGDLRGVSLSLGRQVQPSPRAEAACPFHAEFN